ncbi:MAG: flavodoxin-dependent (E)-4-hydroxy-3-methylbut-2-enyl-diphosphate synthase [Fastidiosipilaceae bacterium]|jgi:(E)-4-hydroxy-3-methylbut-2-enyl-diphosphate synthase|nr:flavodoxin-dependent (E)-4-hydroxy-3-methylbut-2-enyl-diphosphate synthase [Clostridiaceae bacterium]
MSQYLFPRRQCAGVRVGELVIGDGAPIAVQSMNNTDTRDVAATLAQIVELHKAGCDITRVAVLNEDAAVALKEICQKSPLPVVADIHFDYRLALAAIKNGAAKIRINPGNIGGADRLRQVVTAAKERQVAIRVGVNSGSLQKELIEKYHGVTPEALAESGLKAVSLVESCDYDQIVLSVKASDPALTIAVYRLIADRCNYPLHLGVTEAGTPGTGSIRSAVGIGTLLAEGIGDTIRVSLTGDPVAEIKAAKIILNSLGLKQTGPTLISCPTCGRTQVDLVDVAAEIEDRLTHLSYPIKVAVMGCAVNGPGEARDADVGIAGGNGRFLIFAEGKPLYQVEEHEAVNALMAIIDKLHQEGRF